MLGVVMSNGGDVDDTASELDAEAESAASMVFDTVDEMASNEELEASSATKVESDTLIGAEAGTLADSGSDVWTAEFEGTLSAGSVAGNEFGGSAGAVSDTGVDFGSSTGDVAVASVAAASRIAFSGTVETAGGGVVTCAGGAGDGKDGSKRSEGTAGFNKSEPGPETDNKSERNCCSSAGPICWLGVAG